MSRIAELVDRWAPGQLRCRRAEHLAGQLGWRHLGVRLASTWLRIRGLPSEVLLEPSEDPIPRSSAVNLDAIDSVPVGTRTQRWGRLSDQRMRQICEAFTVAVDCAG